MRNRIHLKTIFIIITAIFLFVTLPCGHLMAKTINLKYATHMTDRHRQHKDGTLIWLEKVEEATKGKVAITPYPSQTLCKGRDTLEAVKGGIADIGHAFIGFFPGRYTITEACFLPCLSMNDNSTAENSTRAIMEAYSKFPEMQKEFADVKFLMLNSIQPAFIATKGKEVKKLDDLEGLKIRMAGVYITSFMKSLGVVPMLMPPSQLYENMQKKVIDGYAYSWDGFMSRKMYEVTDTVLDARWYVGAFFTIMNLDVWNSLPKDVQNAIDSVTGVESAVLLSKQIDYDTEPALKKCSDMGIKVLPLSDGEKLKWKKTAEPVYDMWVEKAVGKGISRERAEAILKEVKMLFSKYEK